MTLQECPPAIRGKCNDTETEPEPDNRHKHKHKHKHFYQANQTSKQLKSKANLSTSQQHTMSSARTSSSTSESSTRSGNAVPQPAPRQVSSVCYPKGKWYDCLRPTTAPYQGFGSITNFANMSNKDHQTEAGDNWTRDIYGKMN